MIVTRNSPQTLTRTNPRLSVSVSPSDHNFLRHKTLVLGAAMSMTALRSVCGITSLQPFGSPVQMSSIGCLLHIERELSTSIYLT